ncbi:MAG TPA: CDC48 family AAA ATPase [Firmicutes bacterium]|nr:CDC48 family AAA ATPase [Candidatus Fermentithermobacillaceae bacterium]
MERLYVTLRVVEANTRDVGRGIVRMDPDDFHKIGAAVGDVVQICGKGKTVARVMPAYTEDRGKSIIQMDGILRRNSQVSLDDQVTVHKVECREALKVKLQSLTLSPGTLQERDVAYMSKHLVGLPLMEGNVIRVNLFGIRRQDFSVISVSPPGVVIVGPQTHVEIDEVLTKPRPPKVSYEDIGGLRREIRKIREMIELPLKFPQVFERLGIDPPKGVLLYGPPGCGKTLIAKAVAGETDAYFLHISGPEIMGKFYGESEARLRAIFEEARANTPAIIFIDEIDAIAPKREEMGVEKQVERRVVAQLLSLMDGLEPRGDVIVIAATNLQNSLDPALRRPGRFDREIMISVPDQPSRLEILQIHTRGMPLAKDVDLDEISRITHGFVGADLEALCREAAMNAVRRILPDVGFRLDEIRYDVLQNLEVTMDDFLAAMKEIEPSAIREIFAEVPNVTWEDVGGLESVKQTLKETVEWPLKYPELFLKSGIKPPKGILLYGAPGTGKTLVAKALANESGVNFISVKGPELLSKYVGESERAVREEFRKAKQVSPCILFFDEFDSLVPQRGRSGCSDAVDRVISQFLTEMDGIEELRGVVVLAATNRPDLIDPAILRPGRLDKRLQFPLPDRKAREMIFRVHTRGKPVDDDVDYRALAEATEGWNGSEIAALCREAGMAAIRDFLRNESQTLDLKIGRKHFEEAKSAVMGWRREK